MLAMPRSLWSGSITFGLVNVPVKLFPAVKERDVHFHMVTKDGKCRLRRKLYCPDSGKEYDFKDTARGYEVAPDQYVIINDEELKALKPESGRTIEITDFISLEEIDPVYYNRAYYLAPDKSGVRAYELLRKAMDDAQRVGIAKFIMRDKEYLAAIRPMQTALCLETLNFSDEVLNPADMPGMESTVKVPAKELDMAKKLIEALAGPWEPDRYKENYRERVMELIERKAEGEEVHIESHEDEEPAKVFNLMKALEESLQEAKAANTHTRKRRKSA
jgi:DNA end-binding protein Ku